MTTPLVEMDGDEMTRVLWSWVKEFLIRPYLALSTEYYDLGLPERERTGDAVTVRAAEACRRLGVAVKCATITPNEERLAEYQLSKLYPSPNATIRATLDGTVFRTPITTGVIRSYIPSWERPISIARHAYGDVYKATEMCLDAELAEAKVELVATRPDGSELRQLVVDFACRPDSAPSPGGIVQGMHNTTASITSFARSCFEYALTTQQDLWFSAKDTISKKYDRHFRDVFQALYEADYAERFTKTGITYSYTLIDDAVARAVRSQGGFIWALKNYDGDVISDMVASAFGSLAMMTSVLVSPAGCFEYEAAHGTVQRHYYRWQAGEKTSTNPVATIFAWTGALAKRGQLDGLPQLVRFAKGLESAVLKTIASGRMTADLVFLSTVPNKQQLDTETFIKAVAEQLEQGGALDSGL
ncbi:MAG: NADP-dependent isocitrate dehydrogenase [Actinomycetia bacterium]|nr:NADP-dependent isocitrate dehydrogenase [Actinomycetes bacterium]